MGSGTTFGRAWIPMVLFREGVGMKRNRARARLIVVTLAGALVASIFLAAPASAEPRYDRWQSPAGAVRCRMYVNGSMGQYTLACLIVASNKLVKWGGSFPDCSVNTYGPCGHDYSVSRASSSQRAQFSGARRVSYGQVFGMGPKYHGYFRVDCQVKSSTGSTCQFGPDDPVWINFRSGRVKICAASAVYSGVVCRRIV